MFYNRKGIQKTIINERKEQERLDSLTLNEWMTPGLRRTINNAAAEARHDMTLSWEDMCNPRISTWTRNLKKANRDMSNVMFGNTQWESTGKLLPKLCTWLGNQRTSQELFFQRMLSKKHIKRVKLM